MRFGSEITEVSAESSRRFVVGGDPTQAGIRDWIAAGGAYFVASSSPTSISIQAIDQSWVKANGSDCKRFFWAARDSIFPSTSPRRDNKSIGWSAVQIYYAAFYLILGFLRIYGRSLMYLSRDDCQAISAAPGAVPLQSGVYRLRINLGRRTEIVIDKTSYSGFHEGFWRFTNDELNSIATDMATGAGIYAAFSRRHLQQAILSLEELRDWLGKRGAPRREVGWMSSLRNEVNYKLARKTWSPTYPPDGVDVVRLGQDIQAIINGRKDNIGAMLRVDDDVRAMVERVSILYRNIFQISGLRH